MTKEEIFEVFLENYPWLEEDFVVVYWMPPYFQDFGIKIIFKDGCICEFYYVDNPIDTVAHFMPPKHIRKEIYMTQARININPDKFNIILMQRGLKKSELAVEMGHGRNYFSDIVRRRTMPRPAVVYLQRHYNIDPKEYQVVEKEPVEEVKETKESKPEIPISELTDKQLYRVVYCAVYHAAKKAMEEM